ncbi:MAG: hypothetical protein V2B19_23830 [Pseudomonadota bacterium]
MHTEHLVLESDKAGNLIGIPKFPPNKRVDITFLILDKPEQKLGKRRVPHRDIAGKTQIIGDIFSSASESDWNLPK